MNHLLVLKTLILKLEFETETPHAHRVALWQLQAGLS